MSTGLTVKSLTNMWWTWEIGTGWKPGEITKPGENLVKFSKPGENLVNFQNLLKTWWIFKTWWKPGDFQNLVKTWKTSWNPGEFSKLGKNLVNFQNLVKTWWIVKTWWKRGEFLTCSKPGEFSKPGENLVISLLWTRRSVLQVPNSPKEVFWAYFLVKFMCFHGENGSKISFDPNLVKTWWFF